MGRRAFLGGAVAATAAVTAGVMVARPPLDLWPSFNELVADYRTGVGEQRKIALAERASIEMNTRTSLNIRGSGTDTDSIELIVGEAAVATGSRPVVVRAAGARISASNAQFTVRCDGPDVRVTCLTVSLTSVTRDRRPPFGRGSRLPSPRTIWVRRSRWTSKWRPDGATAC